MKKLIACFSLIALTLPLFSADVKVDNTGAVAGSYTSIQAAINAAANGDRIVVFSNPSKNYTENVTLAKSLTVLCAAQEEYFFLNGNITITPANGREITIVGLYQKGSITSASANAVGARCAVNIVDCKIFGNVTFSHDGFDVQVLYNYIHKTVELRHGKVIANEIGDEKNNQEAYGEIKVTAENVSFGTGDTVFIIANRVRRQVSVNAGMIDFNNPNARYFMANNSLRHEGNNYSTAVRITACLLTDSANTFINNYIDSYENLGGNCTASNTKATVELKGVRTENVVNNVFHTTGYSGGCAFLGMRGDYNYYHRLNGFPLTGGETDNNMNENVDDVDITYDLITGKVTAGGDGIDAGKPGVAYMDIDLTKNDLGPYGGPYSQENYWDAANLQGGRARVYLLNMPSNIYSLTAPTVIKASSTHTK